MFKAIIIIAESRQNEAHLSQEEAGRLTDGVLSEHRECLNTGQTSQSESELSLLRSCYVLTCTGFVCGRHATRHATKNFGNNESVAL